MRPRTLVFAALPALAIASCAEDPAEPGEGAVAINGTVITEAEADVLEQRMDALESRMERVEQVADIRGDPIDEAATDAAVRRADALEEAADRVEQTTDAAEKQLVQ